MASPSVSIDDDLLEDFDDIIAIMQLQGHLPRNMSRSKIIEDLIADWVDEHDDYLDQFEGNGNRATTTTAD